jgi:hypothetical protein
MFDGFVKVELHGCDTKCWFLFEMLIRYNLLHPTIFTDLCLSNDFQAYITLYLKSQTPDWQDSCLKPHKLNIAHFYRNYQIAVTLFISNVMKEPIGFHCPRIWISALKLCYKILQGFLTNNKGCSGWDLFTEFDGFV